MVGHKAVTISWRLFFRSLQESSGGVWVVVAVALLAASIMGQSSARMGEALVLNEIPRSHAPLVLGLWLWATFMATFAYALAVGALSLIRALLADFATRPVSHWQGFLAVQAVTTGGPHSLAGLWLVTTDQLTAWSPPGLVVRILMDDAALRAWAGLAVWTAALAAIELWSVDLEAAPRAARFATTRLLPSLPALLVFVGSAYLLARAVPWPLVTAGVILAAGLFMWAAAVGLLTSVVFPSPSDPHTVGGALVSTPAVLVLAFASRLYLGSGLYLAYAVQTGQWSSTACAFIALALVGAAAAALAGVSRLAPRLIDTRQEALLQALSSGGRA